VVVVAIVDSAVARSHAHLHAAGLPLASHLATRAGTHSTEFQVQVFARPEATGSYLCPLACSHHEQVKQVMGLKKGRLLLVALNHDD